MSKDISYKRVRINKLKIKRLLAVLIIAGVAILVFFLVTVFTLKDQMQQMKYNDVLTKLNRNLVSMNSALKSVKHRTQMLSWDRTISQYVSFPELSDSTVTSIITRVHDYMVAFKDFKTVYLFTNRSDTVKVFYSELSVVDKSLRDFPDVDIIKLLTNGDRNVGIIYTRNTKTIIGSDVQYYTVIGYDGYKTTNKGPLFAVVVNLNDCWIDNIICEEDEIGFYSPFAITAEGLAFSHNGFTNLFDDMTKIEFISAILSSREAGFLSTYIEGVDCMVVYTAPDSNGYRLVQAIPMKTAYQMVTNYRLLLFVLFFILIISGIIVCIYSLNTVTIPGVIKLLDESDKFEKQNNRLLGLAKNQYLLHILSGESQIGNSYVLENSLMFSMNEENSMSILTVYIPEQEKFKCETDKSSFFALKYAILNIAQEIMLEYYLTETIVTDVDTEIVFLFSTVNKTLTNTVSARDLAMRIFDTIYNSIDVSVIVIYSNENVSKSEISELYRKHTTAYTQNLILEENIVCADAALSNGIQNLHSEQSKRLNTLEVAILQGNTEDACALLNEILTDAIQTPEVLSFYIESIKVTIQKALSRIQYPASETIDSSLSNISDAKFNITSLKTINEYFRNKLDIVTNTIKTYRIEKHSEYKKEVDEIIQKHYADVNLSVGAIADHLNLTPSHISRIYHMQSGMTIIDKIVEVRILQSCKLLENTKLLISEIANMSGFNSTTYFHRSFKRRIGMTPSQYRKHTHITRTSGK